MKPPITMRHPKPVVPRTLVALFSAALVFLILYSALISILHNPSMYGHTTDPALQGKNDAIREYITSPVSGGNVDFLTPAEASHMEDVKGLFDAAFFIAMASVGIMLGILGVFAYNRWWPRLDELLGRSLRASGWTILGALVFLAGAALLDFTKLWTLFHLIFFPQGNWQFPLDSTLITLYPGEFFERFVLRWLMYVGAFGAMALVLSYTLERMRRHEAFFDERYEARKRGRK